MVKVCNIEECAEFWTATVGRTRFRVWRTGEASRLVGGEETHRYRGNLGDFLQGEVAALAAHAAWIYERGAWYTVGN